MQISRSVLQHTFHDVSVLIAEMQHTLQVATDIVNQDKLLDDVDLRIIVKQLRSVKSSAGHIERRLREKANSIEENGVNDTWEPYKGEGNE